jgi:hypothetical protein
MVRPTIPKYYTKLEKDYKTEKNFAKGLKQKQGLWCQALKIDKFFPS